jgi:hypothetical protein
MASWFQRIIDTEHWATTWDSVTELYALQIISSAFDDSGVIHFPTDLNYDSASRRKSDEYKKVQENSNEE